MKIVRPGSFTTEDFKEPKIFDPNVFIDWPITGLNQGKAFSTNIGGELDSDTNELLLIPVLVGSSKKGDLSYTCEERHGYKITL